MALADDLTGLFPGPRPDSPQVGFRQGKVMTWNANTGENAILVAGTQLLNVPILNTGEAIALKAGHVVGLLTFGGSWFILGRITPPNDPNFAAASLAVESKRAQATGWSVSTVATVKASGTLTVPLWADEAVVMVSGECGMHNSRAVGDFGIFWVGVNGSSPGALGQGYAPSGSVDLQDWQVQNSTDSQRFTGLSGGETLTFEGTVNAGGGAWAADPLNAMFIQATAIYKSNV